MSIKIRKGNGAITVSLSYFLCDDPAPAAFYNRPLELSV